MIQTYLLENNHRVTLILVPDIELGKKRIAKEASRLLTTRKALSETEIEKLIENSLELKKRQDTPDLPEALEAIPMLKRSDIDEKSRVLPNEVIPTNHGTLLFHDLFTSDILYLDIGFSLKNLTPKQLPFMRLFSRVFT